jgi:signal transduction histidine kinase
MLEYSISSKKRLLLFGVFIIVFLAVLVGSTTMLYRRAERHLDNELGERLAAVAGGLARLVQKSAPDSLSADTVDLDLLYLLFETQREAGLSNIVILTPEGYTVVDLEGYSEPGESNPFIELDFSAVTLARSGITAFTSLYRSGDDYMKSAYAPVHNGGGGVIGIVGVEAGAGFFTVLRELSSLIVFILAVGALAVAVLGFLFFRQTMILDRAQEAILRRENLATMGRMVANIAHDIRNPLSIIKTSAQRLRKKHDTDDEVFDYISEEVDQLNRILTSYLDFAGPDKTFSPQPHSAARIITRCLLVVEPEIEARGIIKTDNSSQNDLTIVADDKRAQQAVMNVLINAVQAVEDGGRIDLSLETRKPYGVIVIDDDGPGIKEKDIGEITKPFYTTRADGSGLGLSIVKSILEEHGGKLEIANRAGGGASVKLYFPLAEGTSPGQGWGYG